MRIQAVEDGLVARIKNVLGNKVRTVDTLPGDWDAEMLTRFIMLMPGVFVVFAGATPPERAGGAIAVLNSNWVIYFATAHASGQAARRRGDAKMIGAYELIQLVVPSLHGYLVPGEGTLSLARIENLYTGAVERQGVAIYAATFQLPGASFEEIDPATLDSFETFDAQWDIEPHQSAAEHEKWLAGDYSASNPEAHDVVKPEQD